MKRFSGAEDGIKFPCTILAFNAPNSVTVACRTICARVDSALDENGEIGGS